MIKTFRIWVLIALFMGILMSFSIMNELQATVPSGKMSNGDLLTPPVSEKNSNKCKAAKPFWDGNKCVECIYTLDCTGNRICDKNKCLCPGKQTFDKTLGDCACDAKKYPIGEHVNQIKCACEKGYKQVKKNEGGYVCMTAEQEAAYKTIMAQAPVTGIAQASSQSQMVPDLTQPAKNQSESQTLDVQQDVQSTKVTDSNSENSFYPTIESGNMSQSREVAKP